MVSIFDRLRLDFCRIFGQFACVEFFLRIFLSRVAYKLARSFFSGAYYVLKLIINTTKIVIAIQRITKALSN
jgi:hypothetical protein